MQNLLSMQNLGKYLSWNSFLVYLNWNINSLNGIFSIFGKHFTTLNSKWLLPWRFWKEDSKFILIDLCQIFSVVMVISVWTHYNYDDYKVKIYTLLNSF